MEEINRVDGAYQLRVKLPFTTTDELSVTELGNEILVQAGRHCRGIMLPKSTRGHLRAANKELLLALARRHRPGHRAHGAAGG